MTKVALQLEVKEARELHKTGSKEIQTILESLLGKDFFSQNVVDRIGGWKDMLAETGRPDTPEFHELPEDLRDHFQKYYRAIVMTEAYNEGEKMNIYNGKARYYPVFSSAGSPASFAFLYSAFARSCAFAGSGSRLSLKDGKLTNYVSEKHKDIYREMLES